MTFGKESVCGFRFLRNVVPLCGLLLVFALLYNDPFLILWWPQGPAEEATVLPLDMAPDSIDDMYDGCRSKSMSLINLYGVFEWHVNINFSYAWALFERNAKKPVHKHLQDDHAKSLYIFTKLENIRQDFDKAVKTGKHKYSTATCPGTTCGNYHLSLQPDVQQKKNGKRKVEKTACYH
ncbi:hypothetical protein ILYODFUR_023521 [Ilyodon furcidens]|uniref:NAD(P)(+)--arginine ADP-ribosyltransferase n=1 Tax=Ilyodon furcidens TaxID=33524 RepID=A0ABV0TL17_9TELE